MGVNSSVLTRPPGRTTRTISDRAWSRFDMLRRLKPAVAQAKLSLGKGKAWASPRTNVTFCAGSFDLPFSRARETIWGSTSTPTAPSMPGQRASEKAKSPVPVATSSALPVRPPVVS